MKKTFSNPCIRCGRERITLKTTKEIIGDSVVINTEKICPNPECQKLVDKDNKKQADRYTAMKLRSKQRVINRKMVSDAKKAKKKKA